MDTLGRLVRLIVTGIPGESLGTVCDLAEKLASAVGREWNEELKKFLKREPCWVAVAAAVVEKAQEVKVYLKRLFENVGLSATDGTETMIGLSASGKPTAATKVTVWEQILDGVFAKIFGSLGGSRRRWTTSQVAAFCRDNRNKLRGEGYGNFFELEDGFVACVHVGGVGGPDALVYEFSDSIVWHARYRRRFFSLQQ